MTDELKVPAVPEIIPETVVPEVINKRQELEKQIAAETKAIFEAPVPEEIPEEEKPKEEIKEEEVAKEIDPIQRIKDSTQKRINQVIAKQKTAEQKLAEAEAEIERLKTPKAPEEKLTPKDDTPPTIEQVEAYIIKMREDGNVKEEVSATRYLIKLEKEAAIREQSEIQTKAQSEKTRQDTEMRALADDYVVLNDKGEPDIKSDMTLANQNGLLFRLAMDYWNDKAKHADRYNNPNVVEGFRRATADAYRDIQEHNKTNAPKGETITQTRRNPREVLAEPEAEAAEESVQSNNTDSLSDADKVRAEIKNRTKNRYIRR